MSPPYGEASFPTAPPQHLYPQLPPQDWPRVPSRPAPPPPPVGLRSSPGPGQPCVGFGDAPPLDCVDYPVKAPLPVFGVPPTEGVPPMGGVFPTGGVPPTGSVFPPGGVPPSGGITPATVHGSHPSYSPHPPFQDTAVPRHLEERWQCGGARLYLVQHDALVVAPAQEVFCRVFLNPAFDSSKCPPRRSSVVSPQSSAPPRPVTPTSPPSADPQQVSVVVDLPRVCRVKLSPARGHALVTSAKDFIAFVDEGTKPWRSVVVRLPRDLEQQHLQQLLELLEQHASLTRDPDGVLTTVTSSVETAFNFTAQKGSELLKGHAPGVAKSTKVLRKGAGTLVRLGGGLVNRGAALVAETVAPSSKEEKMVEFDPMVNQLRSALASVRDQLESGQVATVTTPRG